MIKVSIIVAAAENGIIGKDNVMPWRISSDLQYFKKVTMNKPVIMGRKTFESIGKPLPGRVNIVITRDISFVAEGVIITNNIDTALKVAKDTAKAKEVKEVMVIGGAQIYQLFLPLANRLYLTQIHANIDGDTSFPSLNTKEWIESFREEHHAGNKDSHNYSFTILDRV